MTHFQTVLGFCSRVTSDANGIMQLATHDVVTTLALFPKWRLLGYKEAINHFTDNFVLFGPGDEIGVYLRELTQLGAEMRKVTWHRTDTSTLGNGEVMADYINQHQLDMQTTALSSSFYHALRAERTAHLKHGLNFIHNVPALSFLFMTKENDEERMELIQQIMRDTNALEFLERCLWEANGIGELETKTYVPKK